MEKKRWIVLVLATWMCFMVSLVSAAEVSSWSYYPVKKGDTLSGITWYFKTRAKVPEEKWTEWNPNLGMRNIKPGEKLRYKLPKDLSQELLEKIKKETRDTAEELGRLIQQGDGEIKRTVTDGTGQLLSRIDKLEKELKSSLGQKSQEPIQEPVSQGIDYSVIQLALLLGIIPILILFLILLRIVKHRELLEKIKKKSQDTAEGLGRLVQQGDGEIKEIEETTDQKIIGIEVIFKDLGSFFVQCRMIGSEQVVCPICSEVIEGDKAVKGKKRIAFYRKAAKHLKWHHSHDEGRELFLPEKKDPERFIPKGLPNIRLVASLVIILTLATSLAACGGKGKYVMSQGQINKVPELKQEVSYSVFWCKLNRVLILSEPGLRHDVYFENSDGPLVGIADPKNPERLMVIYYKKVELDKIKAMVGSRSGKHFYPVDGNAVFSQDGFLTPKFDWDEITSLSKSNIQIWEDIKPGSERDKEVKEILQVAGKSLDQLKVPGLFDRVMARVAKITTDDVILAGATDFHSLFGLFGVRLWALVEVFIQKADLSLPYYDTALMDRFQWALSMGSIQEQLDSLTEEQKKALRAWLPEFEKATKELEEYRTRKVKRDQDYQEWLQLKQKFEQNQ